LVSEIDRIRRRSLKLLGFLITIHGYGVTIELPKEGELDLENIGHFYQAASKAFGAEGPNDIRGYYATRSKVLAFQNRHWNLPVPLGYLKKGDWIEKILNWQLIITRIFSQFLIDENYSKVADKINQEFKDFLEKPLTRQQIREILENPVYIGRPKYGGETVEKQFGKIVVTDDNLAFIQKDLFEKAQTIVRKILAEHPHRKNLAEEVVETFGLEVLDFLPFVKVHCRHCDSVMRSGEVQTSYVQSATGILFQLEKENFKKSWNGSSNERNASRF
jgi:hypothetical protein